MKNYDWFRYIKNKKEIDELEVLDIIMKNGVNNHFLHIGTIRSDLFDILPERIKKYLQKRRNQLSKTLNKIQLDDSETVFMFPIMQEEYSLEVEFLKYSFPLYSFPEVSSFKDTKIVTIGSCFADNITKYLQKHGAKSTSCLFPEDINSPIGLYSLLKATKEGSYTHLNLTEKLLKKDMEDPGKIEKYINYEKGRLDTLKSELAEADLVLVTLGNTLEWEDTFGQNKIIANPLTSLHIINSKIMGLKKRNLQGRRVQAPHNIIKASIIQIIEIFGGLTDAKLIFTVSPIPIRGIFKETKEDWFSRSAIVENTISKSRMRSALDEAIISDSSRKVYYFPAFDIANELSSRIPEIGFGNDDGSARQLDNSIIESICNYFIWRVTRK